MFRRMASAKIFVEISFMRAVLLLKSGSQILVLARQLSEAKPPKPSAIPLTVPQTQISKIRRVYGC